MDQSSKRIVERLILGILVGGALLHISCNTTNTPAPTGNGVDNSVQAEAALTAEGRPVGWGGATHSNDATADYAVVFPEAKVNRLDITIGPEDWQAMQDDMTDLYGEPGAAGQAPGPGQGPFAPPDGGTANDDDTPRPGMGELPSEMLEACEDLQEGDACTSDFASGTCTVFLDDQLVCMPDMDFTDFPTNGVGGDGARPGGGLGGGGMLGSDRNPMYVPCTVKFEGRTWWHVGIRYKGQSSLSSTWSSGGGKLPLRLDFDEFEDEHPEIDNQRFYGFKELSLASNWSDSSYLREKVAHDLFREAGVPAPRTAFYRVYIDYGKGSAYFGLYTTTEIPDDPMLLAQFGNDDGNLYKPTSNWVSFNKDYYDKESNKGDEDWSDVEAAIAALHANRTDAAAWRAGLEAVFNVDGFLRWLAVNTVIQNWDTYGNMAQNYYLYGDSDDDGRLNWIPWDNNMALSASGMGRMADMAGTAGIEDMGDRGGMGRALSLELDEVGENWPMIRYLVDDPAYWPVYVSYVRETAEGAFAVEATQTRYQAAHDLIAPYVTGSEGERPGYTCLSDPQDFDDGLDELLDHVVQRQEAVLAFLRDTP